MKKPTGKEMLAELIQTGKSHNNKILILTQVKDDAAADQKTAQALDLRTTSRATMARQLLTASYLLADATAAIELLNQ